MTKRKMYVFAAALAVAGMGVFCAVCTMPGAQSEARTKGDGGLIANVASVGRHLASGAALAHGATNQTPTVRGTLPYVLTSVGPFDATLRQAVESFGAKPVAPVSRNAMLVEASPAVRARLSGDARIEKIEEFAPSNKIQPALAALIAGGATTVDVSLVALADEDRPLVMSCLESGGGEMLKGCVNEGNILRAKLPADLVAGLVQRGDVQWMEQFEYPKPMNDIAVNPPAMNVREVWDVHGLTGAGQNVSTSDTGVDTGEAETLHLDLRNRVKDMRVAWPSYCTSTDVNGHGTHTAGSIVGDGTMSGGQIRGAAHGANLYAWFCGTSNGAIFMPSTMDELYTASGDWTNYIHSASWGSAVNGQYITACVEHDRYVWENPEYLPVFAAGNEGADSPSGPVLTTSISSPGSAKNVLTVGATQNSRAEGAAPWGNGDPTVTAIFSSRGPCCDGRTKPDIAAPGMGVVSTRSSVSTDVLYGVYTPNTNYLYCCGTSMACPLTAGAVALVRQWLIEQKGFEDEDGKRPTAALMKAVIMGGAKGALVPNNDQGWGRVDLAETLFPSGGRAVKLIDRIPFEQGFVTNIIIETTNAAPLDVQLVWVDYPGSSVANQTVPRLVNDLDLTVEARVEGEPSVRYGNGGDKPDTLNNAEVVRLANAAPAKYLITVDCKNIPYDYTEGGAAALYIRGAFDPEAEPTEPAYVHLKKQDRAFMSLDRALKAVRDDDETVEILEWVNLDQPITLTNDCTIVATNENAAAAHIARSEGAILTIAPHATVTLSNVVFAAAMDNLFAVENGGCLKVCGKVDFGVDYNHIAVSTVAEDGFDLAGTLTGPTVIHCDAATGEEDAFGTYSCDEMVARACADRLVCADDIDHELRGEVGPGGTLIWKRTDSFPVGESAGYFVDTAGKTNAYYRMEKALSKFWDAYRAGTASEFIVRRDGAFGLSFSGADEISMGLIFRGEGEPKPVFTTTPDAHFDIVDNGSLVLSNIVFKGCAPKDDVSDMSFVQVKGGELMLASGAELVGFTGRVKGKSGVIDLITGTVTMKSGAALRDCRSVGTGCGGAIYVSPNKDCTLNLEGGTITGCRAATYGGGVYVYNYNANYSPLVNILGDLVVAGNSSANAAKDDIYLFSNAAPERFRVTGEVDGSVGVWYGAGVTGNAKGDAFIANAFANAVGETTLYSFFNDALDGMIAAEGLGTKAGKLIWADDPRDARQCDESEAAAKLIAGSSVTFWREVSDALGEARDGDIVEVMASGSFYVPLSDSVTLASGAITLRAAEGSDPFELARGCDAQITIPSGSALMVMNLTVSGYDVIQGDWPMSAGPLFDVNGGALSITAATFRNIYGNGKRDANTITVYNGGELVASDLQIEDSWNLSIDPTAVKATEDGAGGAILVDHATAYLADTTIAGCQARKGGGVFACNGSTVYLAGGTKIAGNYVPESLSACNVAFSDDSSLVLAGALTARVGVTALDYSVTYPGDTNRVATVAYDWTFSSLTNSAAQFLRDSDAALAVAVTNGAKAAQIVWATALQDGRYVDPRDGTVYGLLGEMPDSPVALGMNLSQNNASPVTTVAITDVRPTDGGLAITVFAREGQRICAVDSERVLPRFEATSDLGDWTKTVELTVQQQISNEDGSTTFTVRPVGNPSSVFIRLAQ